jgi:hypothetical protein
MAYVSRRKSIADFRDYRITGFFDKSAKSFNPSNLRYSSVLKSVKEYLIQIALLAYYSTILAFITEYSNFIGILY